MAGEVASEGKRLEILKRAYDRFYDGGFHATGIDAVMADSGISKRTLYKYFTSKEDLIDAVLNYYGTVVARELFDPVMKGSGTPRERILSFFDRRQEMIEKDPLRACLGMKAAQEYAGKHQGIAWHGENAARYVETSFVELCRQAGVKDSTNVGRQISLLFQGALLVSQVLGDSSPFKSAKAAAIVLLDQAKETKTSAEKA